VATPLPLLIDDPAPGTSAPELPTIVLAHGAGAPMDSPYMNTMAAGLSSRGFRVVRFEFPYMHSRREGQRKPPNPEPVLRKAWHQVIGELGGGANLVIGGKSLGGRIASYVADEARVKGLVCLGYPFHPPGDKSRLRTAHLATLKTPALIVQGTRDDFGTPTEVAGYDLAPTIRLVWMEDGDHSFKPRKASGRTEARNLEEAVEAVAEFVRDL
jgi:predicted alpha/beta-hydrolase family hydrolase